jgi:hypothetical protein
MAAKKELATEPGALRAWMTGRTTGCMKKKTEPMSNRTDDKIDTGVAKVAAELVLWLVGSVGLGVVINHFWR